MEPRIYIVTVKLPKEPLHDPKAKVTGACRLSAVCTDWTGAHHSFIVLGASAGGVQADWEARGYRVTRVEQAVWRS